MWISINNIDEISFSEQIISTDEKMEKIPFFDFDSVTNTSTDFTPILLGWIFWPFPPFLINTSSQYEAFVNKMILWISINFWCLFVICEYWYQASYQLKLVG